MFKYYSSYALVITTFTHLICCGFPLVLGLSSILTNLSLLESLVLNFELLERFEIYLFSLTSVIFLSFLSLEIYNKKIKCADVEDCCSETECDSQKKKIKFNLILSGVFYVISSSLFLSEIF